MLGDELTNTPILLTKFHRPIVPSDHVYRARLMEEFQKCYHHPLTLVSAPAGYGKSTLVSAWLDGCDVPNAWLSLDESDDELRIFLAYFLFAIHTMFSDTVTKTMTLIKAPNLPSLSTLANILANELDAIDRNFILVLDDVHRIREKAVHDFLDILLQHPPRPMHLVIIGRRDPFLSIPTHRARGQLFEIRLQDLRFTDVETTSYLQQLFDTPIDRESAVAWTAKTEGWVTGLRLAALSIKHRGEYRSLLPELRGGTQYVMEYLFNEILSHQPPDVRDFLLKISILDRFCAPLCESLCGNGVESKKDKSGCWSLISLLKRKNLFIIGLDAEGLWYRFHHLFQELLQRQLERDKSSIEIAELHSRACQWFESEGLITESIRHALATGDDARAADIVEVYRHAELSADRWHVVLRWLGMLPVGIRQMRPKLILTEAWIANLQHQLTRTMSLLEQAESLIVDRISDPIVSGEIDFLRGYVMYFDGQAESSLQILEASVSKLSGQKNPFLGEAELMLGLARCMVGRKDSAIRALEARISETDPAEDYLLSRLIAGLAFIYLVCGDLLFVRVEANRLLHISNKHNMLLAKAWSYYFLASSQLNAGEFEAALLHFAQAIELRHMLEPRAAVDAMAGLTLTQQLMGLDDEATESCHRLKKFASELNEHNLLSVARSCKTRLLVLRGEEKPAIDWDRSAVDESPVLSELFVWLEAPAITRARELIVSGTKGNLEEASESLAAIQHQTETANLSCQTIEAAVLQALALDKLGRADEAIRALQKVVSLAGPLGWIRPFIEAGPPMADLLKRLSKQDVSGDYIDRILAAYPDMASISPRTDLRSTSDDQGVESETAAPIPDKKSKIQDSLVEALTFRELEVLELLEHRLQNKEIAERLSISPATVKTHLQNIYQKLHAGNRRQAVEIAQSLSIISKR